MRLIKMFGLAAIAAVAAMAFVGASSASAEATKLCTNHTGTCTVPSTVHFTSVDANGNNAKALLLTDLFDVECNALIQGTVLNSGATIDVATAGLVYTNCEPCSVTVESGGTITNLRLGTELADVTGTGFLVKVVCFGFLKCLYVSTGLVGHGLGPLLTGAGSHVTFLDAVVQEEGDKGLCPDSSKLDALFKSLTNLYIRS